MEPELKGTVYFSKSRKQHFDDLQKSEINF
jgi:hypothetical protein